MSGKFQAIDRDTAYLLPPSLQDWLPEKHLARFVVDMVERLDLRELERCYGGGGKQPYHPALLLALLFYGYATGVFSSRKLEQASYDSVAFRFITGDTHPDHDTIASFRKRFLPQLEGLFVQLLVLAKVTGLFRLGNVSLDGTKIKANASKHKAMSWGYANRLEEQLRREVRELLKQAKRADAEEEPELDIPDELARREDRLAAIEAETSALLGDKVQVIEESGKAIARAKARQGVKAAGQADVARLQRLAAVLLPLVVVAAALLVGLLSLVNVRDRRLEIGILRAVGTRSSQVFALFILKALVLGILGALLGYALGFVAAMWLAHATAGDQAGSVTVAELFLPQLLTWILLLTPLLAALASWLPAMLAVGEDPAVVLRDE